MTKFGATVEGGVDWGKEATVSRSLAGGERDCKPHMKTFGACGLCKQDGRKTGLNKPQQPQRVIEEL